MSTVEQAESIIAETETPVLPAATFWVCRYLPAEVAGTAALILAGVAATIWTSSPILIALAALVGECLGFYGMLAVTLRLDAANAPAEVGRLRPTRLFADEFGAVEIVDTLVIRPLALLIGVLLVGEPVWGLLAGKIAADIVFYTLSARRPRRTSSTRVASARTAERAP